MTNVKNKLDYSLMIKQGESVKTFNCNLFFKKTPVHIERKLVKM